MATARVGADLSGVTMLPPAPRNRPHRRTGAADYVPHARALESRDPLARLQAHALHAVVGAVPAPVAVFHRVNAVLDAADAVGLQTGGPAFALDEEWRRYVEGAQDFDPCAPRRVAPSTATVLTLAHVLAEPGSSRFADYLRSLGLRDRVTLYLRDAGTIVAAIALLRPLEHAPFNRGEVTVLRRLQPLIEHAYSCAVAAVPAARRSDVVLSEVLTPREADVAVLVARGATNAEIAACLHVGQATVKTHLTHVFAKLGVRTRTQLAVLLGAGAQP
jgi:DNA-binding CsgD family transcriptional regulator